MSRRADAIVVLGCRVLQSGALSSAAHARAVTAAHAYLDGVAPRLVVSGGRRWGSHIEARCFADTIAREGVPRSAIVEELCSLSTLENAVFSAAILRRLGDRRVAVVTSPWHMRRALACFHALSVDAVAVPTSPDESSLADRARRFVHEVVTAELDAARLRRSTVLTDHAEYFSGTSRS